MKNEIYDNMLSAYGATTEQERRNAIFEVNQQVILAGLYNGGFFDVAAFYGGTCLRIFHGLQRFSEDMDFSLLTPDDKFDFTKYFQPIIDERNYILFTPNVRFLFERAKLLLFRCKHQILWLN